MLTKIEHLRAETQAAIGEIIELNTQTLIAKWVARVHEEQPTAARVHHIVLLDHMPDFLAHLGRSLASAGDDSASLRQEAGEHGDQRWDTGWSVTEVVRDYQILRLVLCEHLVEMLGRSLTDREALVLNVAIDDAIAASVTSFVASQTTPGTAEHITRDEALDLLLNVFGTVGHELRNPLAPLANSLEILRLAGTDAAQIENARQMMDRQLRVLKRLVDDLMDLPRLARGKMSLCRTQLNLSGLVLACVQDRQKALELSGHRLSVEVPDRPVNIFGDETRLTQVIGNLIGNSQKFTDRGGSVTVRLNVVGQTAVVTVKDSGVGIEPSVLPNVFERTSKRTARSIAHEADLGLDWHL